MSKDKVTDKGAVTLDEGGLSQAVGSADRAFSAAPKAPVALKIKLEDVIVSGVKQP